MLSSLLLESGKKKRKTFTLVRHLVSLVFTRDQRSSFLSLLRVRSMRSTRNGSKVPEPASLSLVIKSYGIKRINYLSPARFRTRTTADFLRVDRSLVIIRIVTYDEPIPNSSFPIHCNTWFFSLHIFPFSFVHSSTSRSKHSFSVLLLNRLTNIACRSCV